MGYGQPELDQSEEAGRQAGDTKERKRTHRELRGQQPCRSGGKSRTDGGADRQPGIPREAAGGRVEGTNDRDGRGPGSRQPVSAVLIRGPLRGPATGTAQGERLRKGDGPFPLTCAVGE